MNPHPVPQLIFAAAGDPGLRTLLSGHFGSQGFEVVSFDHGKAFQHRLARRRPDVAILDDSASVGGPDIVREMRTTADDLPVILLTSGQDDARIRGLEAGADDCVGRDVNPRELQARVQAILRRRRSVAGAVVPTDGAPLTIGAIKLDLQARALICGDRSIRLTSTQFALLKTLASHPFRPFSRDRLYEIAGNDRDSGQERSIDVHILRLRRMIERDPRKPAVLQTVRGAGYVFVPPPMSAAA